MAFISFNPNPYGKNTGDCTIRAIDKVIGKSWGEIYLSLAIQGYLDGDMPSANAVWGAYLNSVGFSRHLIPDSCPMCYTVADFARDHKDGTFILALSNHVVCVRNGNIYDSWDSRNETVLYFWQNERSV